VNRRLIWPYQLFGRKGDAEVVERQMLNVPDLIGQPVHIAQEIAANLGFGLAAGDPDGPGLRSRTWPGLYWVTSQDPPAGSVLERGSQIQITFLQDGQARSDVPEQTGGPTPSLQTHAEGDTDS
jgi:beta-lactam-binding protein with PASTA domain